MRYKVLFITLHPEIGGGETSLFYLLEYLDRKKFIPEVVVTKKGQVSSRLKKMGVKTHIVNLPGYSSRTLFIPGASPLAIYNLYKLVGKIKPSLIHINQPTLAIYAGVVGKPLNIPVVATAHGFWDSLYFYQDIVNNVFIDKIITNSPTLKKTLLKKGILTSNKVEAIPFGIDTKFFKPGSMESAREKLKLPKDKLIIAVVGRLDPQKDHLNFFRAAKIISKQMPNTRYYVVGSKIGDFSNTDYVETIKAYLKRNPELSKRIFWGGFIKKMPPVYQASDLLVMSSAFEGFPLTLLEAASSGLPMVATKSGGVDLVVKNNKTGFLVPPGNHKKLAEKIINLLKDRDLRENLGNHARILVVNKFGIGPYARNIEKTYDELLR